MDFEFEGLVPLGQLVKLKKPALRCINNAESFFLEFARMFEQMICNNQGKALLSITM